jgi:GNAT superfamily N-acetyltransferase
MAARLGHSGVTPPGLTVRPCHPSDAARLAELMARTFREAFGAMNRPEDLAAHLARSYGEEQQRAELHDPAVSVLFAEIDGEPVGYATLRTGAYVPGCVAGPKPIELWRFYLDQPWIGRGVAQPLMDTVKRVARERGGRTLWLGVWEQNPRGIAFYRKSGFASVGTHVFHVGDDPQTDVVMACPLDPA